MLSSRTFRDNLALLSVLAIALSACGGGSAGNASTAGGQGGEAGQGGQGGGQGGQGAGQGGSGGTVDPTLIPLFVAQGHVGRITISCDDGKTWVENRSDDDAYPCFSSQDFDCDHHPGAGRGIIYGKDTFIATFGWGQPGSIRRSKNGIDWEPVLTGKTFAGLAYGNDVFLAGERPPQSSSDGGMTWNPGGDPDSGVWNVRRTGFAAHDGGIFLLAFEGSGQTDVNMSKDNGTTWSRPTTFPAACASDLQWSGGFAYANGAIMVLGGTGTACRSVDGGETWTETTIGGTVSGRLLWTGTELVTWGRANNGQGGTFAARFTSPDGVAWTATPTEVRRMNPDGSIQTSAGPSIGAVARSDAGTYVAVNDGWQVWYDQQRFYRSEDGLSWDELSPGSFTGSHPIQFIAYGLGERSAACP